MRILGIARVLFVVVVMLSFAHSATVARTQTPSPQNAGAFSDLLGLMPSMPLATASLSYSDYDRQLAAFGFANRPTADDMEQQRAALAGMAFTAAGDISVPEWKEAFGFDLWDVDQMMELTGGDVSISLFRGEFDEALLRDAWERADYIQEEYEGATYYSAGDDLFIDFEHPAHSLHFGAFSYFLPIGDDTVVASRTLAGIESVIGVEIGQGASLADGEAAALLDVPSDLVTATVVDGGMLQPNMDPILLVPNNPNVPAETQDRLATQIAETAVEAPRMPAIETILVGATAGVLHGSDSAIRPTPETPISRSIAIAVMSGPVDAEIAAEVAADRFVRQNIGAHPDYMGQPYVELFTDSVFETRPDQPALVIELTPAPGVPAMLLQHLLMSGNLTLLYWSD